MASTDPGSDVSVVGFNCAFENAAKLKRKTKIKVRIIRPPLRDGRSKNWAEDRQEFYS
jgi:hypothetical protein